MTNTPLINIKVKFYSAQNDEKEYTRELESRVNLDVKYMIEV